MEHVRASQAGLLALNVTFVRLDILEVPYVIIVLQVSLGFQTVRVSLNDRMCNKNLNREIKCLLNPFQVDVKSTLC